MLFLGGICLFKPRRQHLNTSRSVFCSVLICFSYNRHQSATSITFVYKALVKSSRLKGFETPFGKQNDSFTGQFDLFHAK